MVGFPFTCCRTWSTRHERRELDVHFQEELSSHLSDIACSLSAFYAAIRLLEDCSHHCDCWDSGILMTVPFTLFISLLFICKSAYFLVCLKESWSCFSLRLFLKEANLKRTMSCQYFRSNLRQILSKNVA